jgi:hypothetical protein
MQTEARAADEIINSRFGGALKRKLAGDVISKKISNDKRAKGIYDEDPVDEEWVRSLNMLRRESAGKMKHMQDVLDEDALVTENVLNCLDSLH